MLEVQQYLAEGTAVLPRWYCSFSPQVLATVNHCYYYASVRKKAMYMGIVSSMWLIFTRFSHI